MIHNAPDSSFKETIQFSLARDPFSEVISSHNKTIKRIFTAQLQIYIDAFH